MRYVSYEFKEIAVIKKLLEGNETDLNERTSFHVYLFREHSTFTTNNTSVIKTLRLFGVL